jgi:hypothetical protein
MALAGFALSLGATACGSGDDVAVRAGATESSAVTTTDTTSATTVAAEAPAPPIVFDPATFQPQAPVGWSFIHVVHHGEDDGSKITMASYRVEPTESGAPVWRNLNINLVDRDPAAPTVDDTAALEAEVDRFAKSPALPEVGHEVGRTTVAGFPALQLGFDGAITSRELDVAVNNHQFVQLVSSSESFDDLAAVAEAVIASR